MLRLTVSLSIVVALAILAAGCVRGEPTSVFIFGNAAVDDQCMVQQDKYQLSGLLDIADRDNYIMSLAVNNQILARPTNAGTDPNGVHFSLAEVSLEDVTGANIAGIAPYSVPATGYVPAATDSSTPGVGYVDLVAIPSTVGNMLGGVGSGDIRVGITLHGETNGHLSMRTDKWYYDVYLCRDCLGCVNVGTCRSGQDNVGYPTAACP